MEKKTGRVIWAAIAGILAGIFLGICIYCAITGTKITNLFQTSSSGKTTSTLSTTAAISPEASTTEPTTTISSTTAIAKNAFTAYFNGWVLVEIEGTKGWVREDLVIHYEDGAPDGIAKPVLYLYPEKKMDVSVKLSLKDAVFSCTYPDYGKGWNITAYPNGKLINKADKKEYSYLYWELDSTMEFDFSKGFIVKGKDTAAFLQKTLAQMGLKPKEYNEFIVYWLPRMQNNEYNLISFQNKTYTDNVKLKISPKPDSVLRVNMAYKPLTAKQAKKQKASLKPQTFPKFERKGFAVVEWGGEEVK